MNNNKEQHGRDIVCRTHSARSERDLYRVCPSKLSKSELEDLYFALLENNLELKRTINGQREKIKTLSTKVQRMSATQKGNFSRESRECCLTTKAIVNEQKDTIADLKKANERMSERIRLLNMRLCSAKQFMKRSPVQSTTHCIKCSSNPPASSPKNSSTVGLNTNASETNLKAAAVSCHDLAEKDIPSTRSVHTEIDEEQEKDLEQPCSENKCRTLMEELKQKIVNLQEELSTAHSEYSSRIGRLETEVSSLQTRELDTQEISSRLTRAEVRNGELAMELSIEKGKVAELETSVKAAQMSSKVAATIEAHLANIKMAKHEYASRIHPLCSPCCPAVWEDTSPRLQIPQSTPSKVVSIVDVKSNLYDKQTRNADDSGYTDTSRSTEIADDKAMKQLNQELMNKIVDMQTQLDRLKVTAVSDTTVKIKEPSTETKVTYKLDEPISMYVKDKGCIIIEAEKEISPEPTVENSAVVQEITVEPQPTPNAQDLTAPSSTNMPAKYPLLWIGDGQKNTEDTDEGSYTIQPSDKPPQIEYKPELVPSTKDDHNKYQIPGPIAVDNRTRRRSSVARCSKSKESHQSIDSSIIKVGDKVDIENKTTTTRKLSLQEEKISPDHKDDHDIDNLSVKIDESKLRKDSVEVLKERIVRQLSKIDEKKLSAVGEKTPKEHNSLLNYYVDPLKSSRLLSVEKITEKKDEPLGPPFPEPFVASVGLPRSCSCLPAPRGTVAFAPDSSADAKRCQCKRASCEDFGCSSTGTQVDYLAAVESCPPYAEASAMEQPRTYTIQIEGRDSRSTDTDHEISAMTDLPTEKDDKSAADTLSPGEDKATSTHSRSYSPPTTDYGTLSEGELPTVGPARKLSAGERPAAAAPVLSRKSSQQKMEEALLAITEELARCKELLLKQRQKEREKSKSVDVEAVADACPAPLALKRAPANQRIADTFTPKCIFTLHIGTVVLSDEAVVNSYDMSLVLTWKFYDQNLAMTRMHAGRVVLFDFSTEYDVKITDDFLNYMKQEEMPIVICELDKHEQPFASCTLPLRDALLHTNRRADMSLALVAGPQLRAARGTTDALDGGDEVGVLDLWCMLRAEPRLLPAINRAIAKPALIKPKSSTHNMQPLRSGSRIMEQIIEDDPSNDRLSQELDLNVGRRHRQNNNSGVNASRWDVPGRRMSVPSRTSAKDTEDEQPAAPAYDYYDVNKYPVVRRRSSQNPHSTERTDSVNTDFGPKTPDDLMSQPRRITTIDSNKDTSFRNQSPMQNMSGVIINEVPANIRSTDEMKQALDRNAHMNSLHPSPRTPKGENSIPTQSSVGSLKSKVAWQRHKMRFSTASSKVDKLEHDADATKKDKSRRPSRFSFAKEKRPPEEILARKYLEEESDQEIARRYDNISRIIGSSKSQDNSKKVTIDHKYCETSDHEAQKETAAEDTSHNQCIEITVLWLALNEECEAMMDPKVQRLYVAYSFLGRSGAELETPVSLPKPKHYVDKCCFNFKKTFQLHDYDLPLLGHMARCRASNKTEMNSKDCIIFSVVSEPPEDPLGLDNCEDIGQACVYLGDILSCSAGSAEYTEVVPVLARGGAVCGVLAVRLDGLHVVRRCLALSHSQRDLTIRW